jgi:isopentenyldiphosphate isomerase
LRPDAGEVAETTWVAWPDLVILVDTAPAVLSPWCVAQVPLLAAALTRSGAA